jgi:hypothetical protein
LGTSFATPAVAAMLVLAQAAWRPSGLQLNALDMRRRLLLASSAQDSLVGKYASGGVPQVATLLLEDGPVVIDLNGSPRRAKSIMGRITYGPAGQQVQKPIGPGFVSAIALGPKDFVFDDQVGRWSAGSIQDLDLSVIGDSLGPGSPLQHFTLPTFRAALKGVITP